MVRVKRGNVARNRRNKILRIAKGFRGTHSKWIVRINAFVREKDMTYSSFIKRLKNSRVAINRKMLAQIAVLDTKCFDEVIKVTNTDLK